MDQGGYGDEPLSLATFEARHAQYPYLTTPRSLEACRRHGINPVELVEVSIDEFRKDFPDDPDAAQRRFDRIDGARRRMLTTVLTEWKHLSDTGWQPKSKLALDKERILDVPAEAHSSMLEMQAAKFRKIEMDQWNALQRMLAMSVKNADKEQRDKEILQKQDAIGESNQQARRNLQLKREQLYKENAEMKKRKEYESMQEIKRLQALDAEEAVKKKEHDDERAREEKERREKRESRRLQQEVYTKQLKVSIMKTLEQKADARKRLADMQTQESQARVREFREQKEAEQAARRKELADKQAKAKQDVQLTAEEQRKAMLDRIRSDEEKRQRIKESRESSRGADNQATNDAMRDKMRRIREANEVAEREKSAKALADLQFKDALAKQELDKVREAQEKRRGIKAIRQEAYDLAATRKRKADDYRKRLAEKAIRDKDKKCLAIQNGFQTLTQMRTKMRDIMHSAKLQLKDELHRLQHRDEFSPDKVIKVALETSSQILFPKLKSAFGMANYVSAEQQAAIEATIGYDDEAAGGAGGGGGGRATTAPNLVSQSTPNLRATATSHGGRRGRSSDDDYSSGPVAGGFTRGELPKTLPIKALNAEKLEMALIQTKNKIEQKEALAAAAEAAKRQKSASPPHARARQPATTSDRYEDDFEDDEGEDKASLQRKKTPSTSTRGGKSPKTNRQSSGFEDGDDGVFKNFPYEGGREDGGGGGKRGEGIQSHKSQFLPTKDGEFRREYSGDHPLAPGGTGHYKKELTGGNKPAGTGGGKGVVVNAPASAMTPTQASSKIEKLTLAAQVKVVDPQRQLEQLRREQNEALMRVLEEEKSAEEARERMSRAVLSENEASRLELVFAEERRRASERIVRLTREHEQRIKEAVLAQMALSKGKSSTKLVPLSPQ